MKAVKLQKEHLLAIKDELQLEICGLNVESSIDALVSNGVGYSLVNGDKVLACGGTVDIYNGTCEGWFLVSKEGNKTPVSVAKCASKYFKKILESSKYHRIQISVLCSNWTHIRFAEFLGFKSEGIMHQFGYNKEDYERMAIWR